MQRTSVPVRATQQGRSTSPRRLHPVVSTQDVSATPDLTPNTEAAIDVSVPHDWDRDKLVEVLQTEIAGRRRALAVATTTARDLEKNTDLVQELKRALRQAEKKGKRTQQALEKSQALYNQLQEEVDNINKTNQQNQSELKSTLAERERYIAQLTSQIRQHEVSSAILGSATTSSEYESELEQLRSANLDLRVQLQRLARQHEQRILDVATDNARLQQALAEQIQQREVEIEQAVRPYRTQLHQALQELSASRQQVGAVAATPVPAIQISQADVSERLALEHTARMQVSSRLLDAHREQARAVADLEMTSAKHATTVQAVRVGESVFIKFSFLLHMTSFYRLILS